jgi:pyridinium-3,5-bisthiocarboxylic acid mononucleotide nickel chelatase
MNMKILHFDTLAGISGDMTLGAFVSAGLPVDELSDELKKLHLPGIELDASHIIRHGIAAVKVNVLVSEAHPSHRSLRDILNILESSTLSTKVKETATKIFHVIGEAEAKVHHQDVQKIHFHEVGALDSIVDIVGTATCLEKFGIEAVYSTPIKLGSGGVIDAEHGKLPLPGPATLEILKGYPTIMTDIPMELTTPTGAAIIKALSSGILTDEEIRIHAIGYGAGYRESKEFPNLLRIVVGEILSEYLVSTDFLIEANIDDMNPEIYPYVVEQFLSHGAKDAFLVPIIMKKGRPGIILSVLTDRASLDEMSRIFFSETTTLGLRVSEVSRRMIDREDICLETKFGLVQMKKVLIDGKSKFIPEFEECKRIAVQNKMPLLEVYQVLQRDADGE